MTSPAPGHIYVLQFSNGTVKVGSSRTPEKRFRQHESDAGAFGIHLVDSWLSVQHQGYLASEKSLIAYARGRRGIQHRQEYFRFVRYSDLCETAERLAAGEAITVNGPVFWTPAEVAYRYRQFNREALHWACVYDQIPYEVIRRQIHIAADDVDDLVREFPDGGPFARYVSPWANEDWLDGSDAEPPASAAQGVAA